ncbi:hypothetical protein CK234_04097 [Phocaeicola vulgatus]|nr:hypothetical protein CK234_04097 [Phocaeicola vulgatus]
MEIESVEFPPFDHCRDVRVFRKLSGGFHCQDVVHSLGLFNLHICTAIVHIGDSGRENEEHLPVLSHRQCMGRGCLAVHTHIALHRVGVIADGIGVELRVGCHHRQGSLTREILLGRFQAYDLRAVPDFLTDDIVTADTVILHLGREYQVQGLLVPDLKGHCRKLLDPLGFP